MPDEPSASEMMRRIEELVRQVRELVLEVRSDYVRKDLYDARHASLNRRVDDLERDLEAEEKTRVDAEKERKAFQRQVTAAVIAGVVLMLAQLVVTVLMAGRLA